MPALVYPSADFQPFTKILSAEVNGKFNAITTLLNTTKLDSTNVQAGGLTLDRLAGGTNNAFLANNSSATPTAVASAANQTLYTNGSGVPTAGTLPVAAGGTGLALTLSASDADKVVAVNAGGTALELRATPEPQTLKIFSFYRFG